MKKLSFLCVVALLFASCASEDNANQSNKSQQDTTNVPTVTFVGYQPETTASAKTRTTATHELGKAAKVYWEDADYIWVKANNGKFYRSSLAQFRTTLPIDKSKANFTLQRPYTMYGYPPIDYGLNPKIFYAGNESYYSESVGVPITILSYQHQTAPNNFGHLAASGDCGFAEADGGGGDYKFTLQHKASYLCFLPRCENVTLGSNIKLQQIEVKADKSIAGKYDFSDGTLIGKAPIDNANQRIILQTDNFVLDNTTTTIDKSAYMVIAPGTYDLSVTYTIVDPTTNAKVEVVKQLNNFNCPEGKIRDVTAWIDKDFKSYTIKYYMWDAQEHYWWQHESDQPSLQYHYTSLDHTRYNVIGSGSNYPQNLATDPQRWYNPILDVRTSQNAAATKSCKDCPNLNEMLWYASKGEGYRTVGVNIVNGHMQQIEGILLKKRAAIIRDTPGLTDWRFSNRFPDDNGVDRDYAREYRILTSGNFWSFPHRFYYVTPSNPSDYFFLPSFGGFYRGNSMGEESMYWTSTGPQASTDGAQGGTGYIFIVKNDYMYVTYAVGEFGAITMKFQ